MLGIIVQLAISWLLLWLFTRKDLRVLGLIPGKKRIVDFGLFFLVTAACCASGFLMRMVLADEQWMLNPHLTNRMIFEGIWWNIKSVLFEELIFRGAILYILIQKLGAKRAIIISAIAFGIYHWFSQNAWGNISQMAFTFFITGLMGLLLAYGYAKTFSLYLPIGIHFGWNLTQQFIFSWGAIGNQLFVPVSGQRQMNVSYFIFLCILIIPMLSIFVINYFLIRRIKQRTVHV